MFAGLMTFSQEQNKLPLDVYNTNMVGGYSLRKIRTNYTGNCIRIRRASDNTETDIGFTATGDLNTAAIATFCSGTTGYGTKWYDQSGNANHGTQATAISQPVIYISGAVPTMNGKPTWLHQGSQGFQFAKTDSVSISNILVVQNTKATPTFAMFEAGTNQFGMVADANATSPYGQVSVLPSHFINGVLTTLTTRLQVRNAFPANAPKLLTMNNWTPNNTWVAAFNLFRYNFDATYPFQGNCSEFIMYYNDIVNQRQQIEANIREYYRLW